MRGNRLWVDDISGMSRCICYVIIAVSLIYNLEIPVVSAIVLAHLPRNSICVSDCHATHAEVTTTTTKAKPGNHHALFRFALVSGADFALSVQEMVQCASC